jgi:nicotinate-nucleotide--dimethylbenzimidazole phosphoribosyltransferase
MSWWSEVRPRANPEIRRAAASRWDRLTKPPGSLGRLETLIMDIAEMQGSAQVRTGSASVVIFCGDHGSTEEGVSAWPSEVTAQMVANFVRGGAAISVLGRTLGIQLGIVDCGVLGPVAPGIIDCKIRQGTRNFTREPAMTREEAEQALRNGVQVAQDTQADIVAVGEMGIGNTASASALVCAFLGLSAAEATGIGSGLKPDAMPKKVAAIEKALTLHRGCFSNPIHTLAALGGFEIATMVGFILESAAMRRPIVIDGFITSSAALIVRALAPAAGDYLLFSHCSAEKAHTRVLSEIGAEPLLHLGMRLGEGSGAALAIGLIRQAHALYTHMATFEEAAVAGSSS